MRIIRHTLMHATPGTSRHLDAWHFGIPGARPKAYLQAGLHSDEWPPMLVASHLRKQLEALEAQGALNGEIVVVPIASPIGLAQVFHGHAVGRFNLADGKNFNRGYPALGARAIDLLDGRLTADAEQNVTLVRAALKHALQAHVATNELQALQNWLMMQSFDADIVLDLHCDTEALMHVYTGVHHPQQGLALARLLGAHAWLTSRESGDDPFDEAVVRPWVELQEYYGTRHPIPMACFAATVEFRGQSDVSHALAQTDAQRLLQFLSLWGVLNVQQFDVPAALCAATPLSAVEPVLAPCGGIVVFAVELGACVQETDTVLELIDPLSNSCVAVKAGHGGLLFARTKNRFVAPGAPLVKIAGSTAFRSGKLLGA